MTYYSHDYQHLLQQYRQQRPDWGSTGYAFAPVVCDLVTQYGLTSMLDYGCGNGSLKTSVMQTPPPSLTCFDEYDPGVVGKETCPDRVYDLVWCRDVLEHIEPAFLDQVLTHLFQLTGKLFWCAIALTPAPAILPDGRNAHLSLLSSQEWMQRLSRYAWQVTLDHDDRDHCWIQCRMSEGTFSVNPNADSSNPQV